MDSSRHTSVGAKAVFLPGFLGIFPNRDFLYNVVKVEINVFYQQQPRHSKMLAFLIKLNNYFQLSFADVITKL